MLFSLIFEAPDERFLGSGSNRATLMWENGHGNDCQQSFQEARHVLLMRSVLAFIKQQGEEVVTMDLSRFAQNLRVDIYTR